MRKAREAFMFDDRLMCIVNIVANWAIIYNLKRHVENLQCL